MQMLKFFKKPKKDEERKQLDESADPQAKFSSDHFHKLLNILELESANFRAAVLESKKEQNDD